MASRRATSELRQRAADSLAKVQMYVTGRYPAWDLRMDEMERYKEQMRPLRSGRVADMQEKLAEYMKWARRLPKMEEVDVAEQLAKECRGRFSTLVGRLLEINAANRKAFEASVEASALND